MSVRQYVGARYVPLFDGAWSDAKAYEPLTIVTYLSNSYTSKKAVPVGTLPTNNEYWAPTGNYNAQIEEYRQDVVAVQSDVSDLQGDVTALDGRLDTAEDDIDALESRVATDEGYINTLRGLLPSARRVICIGDSIAQGFTPDGNVTGWIELFRQKLGLVNGSSFYSSALGGAGMIQNGQGKTFLGLLTDLSDTVTDKETISDIYVVGGVNDVVLNDTTAAYTTAVQNFCTYAKTNYPNAVVHVGCIARHRDGSDAGKIAKVHTAYRKGCLGNAKYINGLLGALSQFTLYASDGIHIGANGQTNIAETLCNETGVSYYIPSNGTNNTAVISGMLRYYASIEGDNLRYWTISNFLTPVSGQVKGDGTPFKLGDVTEGSMFGLPYSANGRDNLQTLYVPGFAAIEGSGGSVVPAIYNVYHYNGEQWCRAYVASGSGYAGNLSRVIMLESSGTIPLI